VLKPSARALITLWVLVTVPMMALMLLALIAAVPRLLGSAGAVVSEDAAGVAQAWRDGSPIDVAGNSLQVLGVILPLLACALILGRISYRTFGGLARWSRGSAGKRVVAAALSAMLVTALSWAWWPHPGTYRPIEPGERGTLAAFLQDPPQADELGRSALDLPIAGSAAQERLSGDDPLVAAFQEDRQLPTKDDPDLALVLVPTEGQNPDGSGDAPDEPWVFPFDKPLPPDEGDNQALAVATQDGSVTYDLAFALVWAEGDEVLNVNEAHAYASCSDCVAVAVAFQVVLIMDDAQVVVPQNLATAANYDCYQCITAAIASQLVLSVQDEPGEEDLRALGEVWDQLIEFAHNITAYSLSEITAQLEAFKAEIITILDGAPPVVLEPVATASASPTAGSDGDAPTSSPTASPTTSPSPDGTTTAAPSSPSDDTTTAPPPTQSEPASPTPSPSSGGSGDTQTSTEASASP
jgi:putative peptide zinc metalloprotease protein